MSDAAATLELAFDVELPAPPARVFAALTEARHLTHWFCDRCESEPRAGGALTMRWEREGSSAETFVARWSAFDAPTRCGYRGGHAGYPDGDAGTVGFTLEPAGAGTRLRVHHTLAMRPENEPIAARYRAAWPRALARLAACLTPTG